MLKRLWKYLNPMAHLGEKKYPLQFPFFTTITIYVFLEFLGYVIWKHPDQIGNIIIFTNFALVLYFSFRSATKGGLIVLFLSVIYYSYYLFTRQAPLALKEAAGIVAALLSLTNLLIVLIVGWHRKSLDNLLDNERQAKLAAEHEKKRWQTLMKQLPVGVIIAQAPTGEIISRNDKADDILGSTLKPIKSLEDFNSVTAITHGTKLASKDFPISRALLKGETVVGEEVVIDRKGNQTILFVNADPIRDSKGDIIAAVTTFYDITKQKELERQKDDFIAIASHELKTPLTSAKIYTQALLQGSVKNSKTANLSAKVNEQLETLSLLITTMLDATRMEQGRLQLNEESFILRDIALRSLEDLERTTNRKLTIDWQTREYVYGSKERLSQVFTNLITNAMKFSPPDSEIIVTSQKKDGFVIVNVQDFGTGLTKEDQKHVFDKFYHADEHKTYPGLGLGLYISSEIVKQYGGNMWVESEKGKGATFSFSLPIYTER